jgi:dipeptidyl aminopeptidase/acylaminoacyl peptidase
MGRIALFVVAFVCIGLVQTASAQRPDFSALLGEMDRAGKALHESSGVLVMRADHSVGGKNVEAILFAPPGEGPFPGLLLIPGYATTARDWVSNGLAFAAEGYCCLAVSQPGFGTSEGPADFVGPATIDALKAGYSKLLGAAAVDPARMGIVGYSRGALAACLLAIELPDVDAVVLGAGIYDFQAAYDSAAAGIKANMEQESGMTAEAIADRSPLQRIAGLTAPLLILHGDSDANAPVEQAFALEAELKRLGKDYETVIFSGAEHSIGIQNFREHALDFLERRLATEQ